MKLLQWREQSRAARLPVVRARRIWQREALILVAIPVALLAGYATVFHFGAHLLTELASNCTHRLKVELSNADLTPADADVPAAMCDCLIRKLLDHNGIFHLALVDIQRLDPMALHPVTGADQQACVDQWWR